MLALTLIWMASNGSCILGVACNDQTWQAMHFLKLSDYHIIFSRRKPVASEHVLQHFGLHKLAYSDWPKTAQLAETHSLCRGFNASFLILLQQKRQSGTLENKKAICALAGLHAIRELQECHTYVHLHERKTFICHPLVCKLPPRKTPNKSTTKFLFLPLNPLGLSCSLEFKKRFHGGQPALRRILPHPSHRMSFPAGRQTSAKSSK